MCFTSKVISEVLAVSETAVDGGGEEDKWEGAECGGGSNVSEPW